MSRCRWGRPTMVPMQFPGADLYRRYPPQASDTATKDPMNSRFGHIFRSYHRSDSQDLPKECRSGFSRFDWQGKEGIPCATLRPARRNWIRVNSHAWRVVAILTRLGTRQKGLAETDHDPVSHCSIERQAKTRPISGRYMMVGRRHT